MSVPITISFGSGFNAAYAGTTEQEVMDAANDGWARWMRYLYTDRVPSGVSFEVQIITGSTSESGGVAEISVGTSASSGALLHFEMLTGQDANGTAPDAVLTIGPNFATREGGPTTVLAHEFGHALGFLNRGPFEEFKSGTDFVGTNAVGIYGGPVPILQDGSGNHIAPPAPSIMGGNSTNVTQLDAAILADIGYPSRLDGSHNTAPVAVDDNFIVMSGSSPTLRITDNDVDADGDILSYIFTSNISNVGVLGNQDGTFTLFPPTSGSGWFEYQLSDGFGGSDIGIGRVTVGGDGTDADETIVGDASANSLKGNGGADRISGQYGADVVYGNTGPDLIYGNQDDDTLFGGQDGDTLFGGQQSDAIYGNYGADVLYGNYSSDAIFGGQGDDTLYGGQGDDTLFGNIGDDLIYPNLGADLVVPGNGADSVIGFDGVAGDRLALSSLNWTLGSSAAGDAVLSYSDGSITLIGIGTGAFQTEWIV